MKKYLISKSWKTNVLFFCMMASFVFIPYLIRPLLLQMNVYQMLLTSQCLIWLPIIPYLFLTRQNPRKLISFRLIGPLTILLLIIMAYSLLPVAAILNLLTSRISSNAVEEMTTSLNPSLALNLLFVAVLPAVSEELICRGVLFSQYRKQGIWIGILFSALCFGILHMNINQFSYAFCIGIAFAIAYEATGSIFAGMVMHFTFNANSVIMLEVMDKLQDLLDRLQSLTGSGMGAVMNQNAVTGAATDALEELTGSEIALTVVVLAVYSLLTLTMGYLCLISIAKLNKRDAHMKKLFGRFWLNTDPKPLLMMPQMYGMPAPYNSVPAMQNMPTTLEEVSTQDTISEQDAAIVQEVSPMPDMASNQEEPEVSLTTQEAIPTVAYSEKTSETKEASLETETPRSRVLDILFVIDLLFAAYVMIFLR